MSFELSETNSKLITGKAMITRRALYLLLLLAPILALGTITSAAFWGAGLYVLAMLVLLGADFALSPAPHDFKLSRQNDSKLSLGADNPVRLTVHRTLRTPHSALHIPVRDEPPTGFI